MSISLTTHLVSFACRRPPAQVAIDAEKLGDFSVLTGVSLEARRELSAAARALARRVSGTGRANIRGPAHFSLSLLDVDHFQRFNDEHGHNAGDAVLTGSARGPVLPEKTRPALAVSSSNTLPVHREIEPLEDVPDQPRGRRAYPPPPPWGRGEAGLRAPVPFLGF